MEKGGADVTVAVTEEVGEGVADLKDNKFKHHDSRHDQEVGLVIDKDIVFKAGGRRRLFLEELFHGQCFFRR